MAGKRPSFASGFRGGLVLGGEFGRDLIERDSSACIDLGQASGNSRVEDGEALLALFDKANSFPQDLTFRAVAAGFDKALNGGF